MLQVHELFKSVIGEELVKKLVKLFPIDKSRGLGPDGGMVDTPDLGSGAFAWRFKSSSGHHLTNGVL